MHARYQVRLRRYSRWWAIDVPALAVFTQCRTLDEAEHAARLGIAAALKVPLDAFAVDLVLPEAAPVLRPVVEARRQRAAAEAGEEQALADAVQDLIDELGVSQLDACRILGVSQEGLSQEGLSQLTGARPPVHGGDGGLRAGSRPAASAATRQFASGGPAARGPAPHAARPPRLSRRRPSWAIGESSEQ